MPINYQVKGIGLDRMPPDIRDRAKALANGATIKGVLVGSDGLLLVEVFTAQSGTWLYETTTLYEKPPIKVDFESKPFDMARYLEAARAFSGIGGNKIYATGGIVRPSEAGRWMSCGGKSPFPAFVAPERPAEPAPTPDTPAVATLKALLADRRKVLDNAQEEVDASLEAIQDLEEELAGLRKELEHDRNVVGAASKEVHTIIADIVKLGGKVEDQS